jgi:co-chaperonin GroES (HSP10)
MAIKDQSRIAVPNRLRKNPDAVIDLSETDIESEDEADEESVIAKQLPEPTGWRILVALPEPEKTTKGGILKAEETLQNEEIGSICSFVLKIGPDAFKDPTKFPNGAYCKEGDFVITRAFSGTRFKCYGKEFRLINDTSVEAVVADPRGILRI